MALLNVHGAARHLCVGRSTVYVLVNDHGLPYVEMPSGIRFRPESLDEWSRERERRNRTASERASAAVEDGTRRAHRSARARRLPPPPSPHAGTRARLRAI